MFNKYLDFIEYMEFIAVICTITGWTAFGGFRLIYELFPHVNTKFRLENLFDCYVEEIGSCTVFFPEADPDYGPGIIIDITNNSTRPIIINDYDGCEILLEEYIPYDELLVTFLGDLGAMPWEEPKSWNVSLGAKEGVNYAVPEKNTTNKGLSRDFFEIEEKGTDRFIVWVKPLDYGYYRFKVLLNYQINNSKKTIKSKEYYEYVKLPPNAKPYRDSLIGVDN